MGAAQLWGLRGLPKSDALWVPSSTPLPLEAEDAPAPLLLCWKNTSSISSDFGGIRIMTV